MKNLLMLIGILLPLIIFAHGQEEHKEEKRERVEDRSENQMHQENEQSGKMGKMTKSDLATVNIDYQSKVKPIFEEKCIDCHGVPKSYPWYYRVPGIKQIMDYDITEAKEHLDMSNDFPFGGHGTPESDLEELRKTVNKDEMPPIQYWIFHPDSRLTDDEKQIIFQWIDLSLARLNP